MKRGTSLTNLVVGTSNTRTKPLSKPHAMTWALGWNTTQRQDSRGAENSNSCSAEVLFHTRMVPSSAAVTTSVDAGRRNGVGGARVMQQLRRHRHEHMVALNPPSMA